MPFDFSLKDSIIPVSSTLIAASLIFSLINLMNQYYRIKIECLGWKKFFIPISLFVFFAAISSLVPYCSGAPFYCFGYPIFWNALSLACLIYFIYHLCNFILFEITYKENKKEYLRFIQACVRRNVETLLYINSIEKSIYDLVEDAQKEPPKENDLFEFSVQENNKYAWDVISLLSIRNVVKKIVENDSLFIQSVLNAYKEKGCARLTNVRLLNALIYQLVDNENSFLNLNNSGLKKEIIGNFFSKDLCSNFDTIGVFTIISKFNDEQQSTLELIFSRALDVTDVMHFGFASVLDSIKWELNKEISDRKILSYDKLYRETLDKCCKHSWNPIDAHNKDFYIRRFMDYFDALYLRNLKKGEYHLYLDLLSFWNILKENQNSEFSSMIFNHFVDKLSTETHEYAYLVKIYLLMKKYGQDIAMLTQTFLPIIQKKLRENEIEAKIVEKHLPYGLKKQDVLDMQ